MGCKESESKTEIAIQTCMVSCDTKNRGLDETVGLENSVSYESLSNSACIILGCYFQ